MILIKCVETCQYHNYTIKDEYFSLIENYEFDLSQTKFSKNSKAIRYINEVLIEKVYLYTEQIYFTTPKRRSILNKHSIWDYATKNRFYL